MFLAQVSIDVVSTLRHLKEFCSLLPWMMRADPEETILIEGFRRQNPSLVHSCPDRAKEDHCGLQ
jgi:hypothetical protein